MAAPGQSIVEDHPQRAEIDRAILRNESSRAISRWCSPPVSHSAVNDYRKRVTASLRAKQAKRIAKQAINVANESGANVSAELIQKTTQQAIDRQTIAQPFIRALERKYERYERWMQGAEAKEDYKALAAIDRAETGAIQLQAQLADAFPRNDAAGATQVNIAICLPEPVQSDSGPVIDIDPL